MTKKAIKKKTSSSSTGKKGRAKASTKTSKKDNRSVLEKELKSTIGKLGIEEIQFLLQQARVLEQRKALENKVKKSSAKKTITISKTGKAHERNLSLEVKEADDGSYFFINFYEIKNIFTLAEMRKLVSLCHASKHAKDASSRLYAYFERNRWDVVKNTGLEGSGDPVLKVIYEYIVNHYTTGN